MPKRPITLNCSASQLSPQEEQSLLLAISSLVEALAKQELSIGQTLSESKAEHGDAGLGELPDLGFPR